MVILDFLIENKFSWGLFPNIINLRIECCYFGSSFLLELSCYFGIGGSLGFPSLREAKQYLVWLRHVRQSL